MFIYWNFSSSRGEREREKEGGVCVYMLIMRAYIDIELGFGVA